MVRKSLDDAGIFEEASEIETVIGTFDDSCAETFKADKTQMNIADDNTFLILVII